MKNYIFVSFPPVFNSQGKISFNEVEAKIISEETEQFKISVVAKDIIPAIEKAKENLSKLINLNFGDLKNIDFYEFRLKLISIEELP